MTDPKRWSSRDSEIDPVLRSVLRYAKDFAPTPSETQALLRRVSVAENASIGASPSRFAPRKRAGTVRAVALAVAFGAALGSVAWAGYATYTSRFPSPSPAARDKPEARQAPRVSSPSRLAAPAALPSAAAVPLVPADATSIRKAPESPRTASAQSAAPRGEATLQSEADLLQSARSRLGAEPSDTLRLTREHAALFPSSALSEERSALEVEALLRLGRKAEADNALVRFEVAHPRSPYRRRLRALLPP